tara:strand:- start:265 stop:2010 length:1746 start_codon:yes stop_codon:yes gene_type:complete
MANTTVKSEQIEDGSITADKIADGAIVATELASNSVTTAKINADAVTGAKIADDAIDSEHYVDGSIDTAHIGNDQVTQAKIADDAVGADQLAASAVVTASIVDDNVTTAKIADGNISTALLADLAVTSAKLANNIDIVGTFDVTGATTLDSTLSVGSDLTIPSKIIHAGDTDTYLRFANADDFRIVVGNSTRAAFNTSKIHFNQEGIDQDFQVEGDNEENLLYVDASTDRIGIGTASPARTLHVNSADANVASFEGHQGEGVVISSVTNGQIDIIGYDDGASAYNPILIRAATTGIYLDTAGDVHLGQTSQTGYVFAQKLVVGDGDDNDGITIQSGSTHQGNLAFNNADGTTAHGRISYQHGTNFMAFFVNNAEKMRVDSSGVVHIGTTIPYAAGDYSTKLDQYGRIYLSSDVTGGGDRITFANPNGTVGTIRIDGSSTAYNTSSDYRLKENVDYTWDATTRLKQLKPARFNFIADDTKTVDGFLAHEVSSIVPEAISGQKDETEIKEKLVYDSNDSLLDENIEESDWTAGKSDGTYPSDSTWVESKTFPVYQGIDQAKLVPLLVKTIQELEARIKTLEDS